MDTIITEFEIASYDDAFALWERSDGVGLSSADSRDNIRRFLDRNPGTSFIAEITERVIGTILGGQDGRRGYIYHMAVDPDFRQQGIGHQLLGRCLERFKNTGIQKCHILFFNENAGGAAFWNLKGGKGDQISV